MSLDDDLSLSFASSMGIENIQDEYLDRSNLYTDLDQLEKSVDAEFEEYMNRARSFPFKQQDNKSLDDASVHSDYEIVGEDPANPDADQEDMDDGDNDSWQRYLANRHSDEHYQPQGDPSFSKSQSRSTSPGEYFGARSLPFDYDWQKQADSEEEQQEEEEEEGHLDNNIHVSSMNRAAGTIRLKSHILVIIQKWQQQQQQQESTENCHPKIIGFKICTYPKYELPEIELHHPYTQKQTYSNGSSVSSTRQQCPSRSQQHRQRQQRNLQRQIQSALSDNRDYQQKRAPSLPSSSSPNTSTRSSSYASTSLYTIEPASPLQFLCEMSPKTIYAKVIHLRIQNTSSTSVRSFSLFSAKNMLDFEMSEGLILEHEVVEIKIKIQSSALVQYQRQHCHDNEYSSLSDKILVLIDHRHVNELDVNIDFMALQDPEQEEEEKEEEQKETSQAEALEKEQQQHLLEHNLLLSHRPKCRFCALEKGYPLYSL
ncbi:hypothetical protein MUCCIDRAFT_168000 [Mucor lusitanicus CBS 277.49]|uniref:Uncharacterized protein n=1 Tax=Mucor lusitanicus CBS 277.49 TaxID=747725 RepID=A0A168GMI3_MUCCL|nr:hypothetical protein MUCCIDRAFT_168000 [Mucor lusitanicus CBS 277.49]